MIKKKPILFGDITGAVTADTFNNNGIGVLSDAISCLVTEELDGEFELVMRYSVTGKWHSEIATRRIIYAVASEELGMQPFRIYRITKPMNGRYTVYARHLSYDAAGVQVQPFTAYDVEEALAKMEALSLPSCPFTLATDKTTSATMEIKVPRSLRNALLGEDGSLLSTYKGDFLFDHSTIKLMGKRGEDRGFTIKYGKNLRDINQDDNISNLYTGVYPYIYRDAEEEGGDALYIEATGQIVEAEGSFGYKRIKSVDLTDANVWNDIEPTAETLRLYSKQYMRDHNIGVPTVSITAKIYQLQDSSDFQDDIPPEKLYLGDTVNVFFENIGIDVQARIVKTVYDSLLFRLDEVQIGSLTKRITDTFQSLENTVLNVEKTAGSAKRAAARLTLETSENSAIVHAIAEVSEDGTVTGKGEFFIKAINGVGSEAYIGADKIAIQGSTTFSSLFTKGKTTIDGSKITANTVTAAQLNVEELSALGATVGGWTIAADRIYKAIEGSESSEDSPCGMYSGDMYTHEWDSLVTPGITSHIRFYAGGSPVDKTCKFAVLEDGSVYLGAAQIFSEGEQGMVKIDNGVIDIIHDPYHQYDYPFIIRSTIPDIDGEGSFIITSYDDDQGQASFQMHANYLHISALAGLISGTWSYGGSEILTAKRLHTAISNSGFSGSLTVSQMLDLLNTL